MNKKSTVIHLNKGLLCRKCLDCFQLVVVRLQGWGRLGEDVTDSSDFDRNEYGFRWAGDWAWEIN